MKFRLSVSASITHFAAHMHVLTRDNIGITQLVLRNSLTFSFPYGARLKKTFFFVAVRHIFQLHFWCSLFHSAWLIFFVKWSNKIKWKWRWSLFYFGWGRASKYAYNSKRGFFKHFSHLPQKRDWRNFEMKWNRLAIGSVE